MVAYCVVYGDNAGWDLISADKRVAPQVATADNGGFDLVNGEHPAVESINNLLMDLKSRKWNTSEPVNSIWAFLDGDSHFTSIQEERAAVRTKAWSQGGMWIALDTVFVQNHHRINPRLITTSWGLKAPWNTFTPYLPDIYRHYNEFVHATVGCMPVAVGQILYRYNIDNPTPLSIPTSANLTYPDQIEFGDFSPLSWQLIAKDTLGSEASLEKTAVLLSWLGRKLDVKYLDSINTIYKQKGKLEDFLLESNLYFEHGETLSNSSSPYVKENFCATVISSLDSGSPVLLTAYTTSDSSRVGSCIHHRFLRIQYFRFIDTL